MELIDRSPTKVTRLLIATLATVLCCQCVAAISQAGLKSADADLAGQKVEDEPQKNWLQHWDAVFNEAAKPMRSREVISHLQAVDNYLEANPSPELADKAKTTKSLLGLTAIESCSSSSIFEEMQKLHQAYPNTIGRFLNSARRRVIRETCLADLDSFLSLSWRRVKKQEKRRAQILMELFKKVEQASGDFEIKELHRAPPGDLLFNAVKSMLDERGGYESNSYAGLVNSCKSIEDQIGTMTKMLLSHLKQDSDLLDKISFNSRRVLALHNTCSQLVEHSKEYSERFDELWNAWVIRETSKPRPPKPMRYRDI